MRVIADDASLVVTVVSSLCLSFSSRSLLLSAAVIERKQYCRSVAARRRMRNRLRNARAGRFALREPAFGNPPARSPTCEMRIVSRLPTRIIDARNIHSFAPSLSRSLRRQFSTRVFSLDTLAISLSLMLDWNYYCN